MVASCSLFLNNLVFRSFSDFLLDKQSSIHKLIKINPLAFYRPPNYFFQIMHFSINQYIIIRWLLFYSTNCRRSNIFTCRTHLWETREGKAWEPYNKVIFILQTPKWIFFIIKPTRCTNFSNLLLEWNSPCFGQFLCPSPGVFHCTHSNVICHTDLLKGLGWNPSYILIPRASYQQNCMTYITFCVYNE
jgi:hypothetical protein